MIKIKNLNHQYNETCITLDNVSYEFNDYGLYIIKGKSGSGKSTFLKLLLGLLSPNKGTITIDNIEVNNKSYNRLMNIVKEFDDKAFIVVNETKFVQNGFIK